MGSSKMAMLAPMWVLMALWLTLVAVLIIILITKILLWVIKKGLFLKHIKDGQDTGNRLALFQIIKYIIWVISFGLLLIK